jgi:hypothetical protein
MIGKSRKREYQCHHKKRHKQRKGYRIIKIHFKNSRFEILNLLCLILKNIKNKGDTGLCLIFERFESLKTVDLINTN